MKKNILNKIELVFFRLIAAFRRASDPPVVGYLPEVTERDLPSDAVGVQEDVDEVD